MPNPVPPPLLLHAMPLAQLLPPLLLWRDAARAEQHLNGREAAAVIVPG